MTPFEIFFRGTWGDLLHSVPRTDISWDRKAAWLYWTDAMGQPAPTFSSDPVSAIKDAGDNLDDLFG